MWLNAKLVKQRTKASSVAKTTVISPTRLTGGKADGTEVVDPPTRITVGKAVGTEVESPEKSVFNGCMESVVLNHALKSQNDEKDSKSPLSVSDYPSCGYRLLINACNNRVAIPQNEHQPLPIWDVPKSPECVLRVAVTSADRSRRLEVNALFSIDAQITSVSETLACKLGLKKKGVLICSGLGCTGLKAYLPSRHVDITCLDVVHNHSESLIPGSTRMALLIVPQAGRDLVLGMDWYRKIKSTSYCVLDFATDQARIHFLPKGKDAKDKRALLPAGKLQQLHRSIVGSTRSRACL